MKESKKIKTTVRSVSIPEDVAAMVDQAVENSVKYQSFSHFVTMALVDELSRNRAKTYGD